MQKTGWTLNINIEWKIMMIFLLNDAKLFIFIEHLGSYILSHVCDLFCKNVEWRSVRKSFLHSTHPKYLLHIPPPACWKYIPLHWSLSFCCLNSTGPQINFKSERNTQIFYSEKIISCKNGDKGANFFNWERPIVQCIDIVVVLDDNLLQMPSLEIWLEYAERHSGMLLSEN